MAAGSDGRFRGWPLLLAIALVGGGTAALRGQTFRSSVDVIAVDVQVIDHDSYPIGPLDAKAFEVSINKQRRKVITAQFIRHSFNEATMPASSGIAALNQDAGETFPGGGRTFIIAVDNGSFDIGTANEAMEAMSQFVARLEPRDRIGLYVYPNDLWMAPTTERAAIRIQLAKIVGDRQALRSSYNLTASEIVDISAQSNNPNSFRAAVRGGNDPALEELDPVRLVQRRECQNDANCLARIYAEGIDLVGRLEDQTQGSLDGLRALMLRLTTIAGRKAVIVVSAGVLVSDRVDGRPQIGDQAVGLGQTAARANATVYTLHVDSIRRPGGADRRGPGASEHGRERAMYATFLDQFASAAGGKRLYVPVGGGELALDRVLRESSGYYLLGVQPEEADRDGKPRELKVKVNRRGATVRSRQWVLVPARERF
jgi:VWFA-related protein